ncbi:MAG: trigger factor [Lachnospiraceae bacterium]|nr:trigger factor [Lachnospiraceae bacterium]
MKKALTVFTVFLLTCAAALSLSGCGKKTLDNVKASDYVKLGNYKGLSVTVGDTSVSEEDIDNEIKNELSSKATRKEVTDRPAADGDTVNIDYVGKKDGVAFEGGTADGYDLTLGSGTFIPGFEDGIVDHKIGETFDLPLTFPENYGASDLAGQDVIFTVTLNSISENELPELTDSLAHELNSEADTVAELREDIRKSMETARKDAARTEAYSNLLAQVQTSSEVAEGDKLPKWLIDSIVDTEKKNFENGLAAYGTDLATYLSQSGITEEQLNDQITAYAQTVAGQELLVHALAQAEGITVSDADIEAQYEEYAMEYGYASAADFKKSVEDRGGADTFRESVLTRKVQEMLFANAEVADPENVSW